MDIWTREKRSDVMSRIRSGNTKPEIEVRSLLHKAGYRFRLHGKDLPGRPDIVLPKYKTVIFVHGCFWHVHEGCKDSVIPKTNTAKWEKKLFSNAERDKKKIKDLKKNGWNVVVIWECQVRKKGLLEKKILKLFKK